MVLHARYGYAISNSDKPATTSNSSTLMHTYKHSFCTRIKLRRIQTKHTYTNIHTAPHSPERFAYTICCTNRVNKYPSSSLLRCRRTRKWVFIYAFSIACKINTVRVFGAPKHVTVGGCKRTHIRSPFLRIRGANMPWTRICASSASEPENTHIIGVISNFEV